MKKKASKGFLLTLTLLILAVVSAISIQAATLTRVTTTQLNMRKSSVDGAIITKIPAGSTIIITGYSAKNAGWYYGTYMASNGTK